MFSQSAPATVLGLSALAASASALFDGGLSIAAVAGGLALTGAGGTIGITTAGAALGLLGAGIVKGALIGRGFRLGKREAGDEAAVADSEAGRLASLQLVDAYFTTILDVDVDDCGKKLVCEIMTLESAQLAPEEGIIRLLFEEAGTAIDPLSSKAEYDLAAFVGNNYNKETCARRYHKCSYDRQTILQGLRKLEKEVAKEE